MNSRERVLAHLQGLPVDRLPLMPITMMFAADLIEASYRHYAQDYRVLVQGQMATAEAYDLDYVNTMSDPAREAADCGATIEYFDNQPPAIVEERALLRDKATLLTLKTPDPLGGGRMHNGVRAVALLQEKLQGEKLIEGWIEGPCAEAADLRGINRLMIDFFDDAAFVRDLFEFAVQLGLKFAKAQIEAGADLIGMGDAAASLVGPQIYNEFVWPYEKKMVVGIHAMGGRVRLHICGNIRKIVKGAGLLNCEVVDLDSMVPIPLAREQMGPRQVLLGNINPVSVLRDGAPELVHATISQCHRQAGASYIVGAGCEVPRDTPAANLRALCGYAHEHKP